MRTRLLIGAAVGFATLATAGVVRGEEGVRYQDVTLSATVSKANHLGQDIVITLILTSKSEQPLCSMNTADLTIVIQDVANPKKKYVCERGRVRSLSTSLPDGRTLRRTVEVKKRYIEMTPTSESRVSISVLRDCSARLSCGSYVVSVLYEGKVQANAKTSVAVDYERSVPALIDLIAGADEWTRAWARDNLFSIIGQPVWKPSRADTKDRIDLKVAALRKWWEDNKDLILLVESRSKQAMAVGR